jgi:hypothetical protein
LPKERFFRAGAAEYQRAQPEAGKLLDQITQLVEELVNTDENRCSPIVISGRSAEQMNDDYACFCSNFRLLADSRANPFAGLDAAVRSLGAASCRS